MLIFCDLKCRIDGLRYQYRTSLPEPVNFSAINIGLIFALLTFRIEETDQAGVHPESNLEWI